MLGVYFADAGQHLEHRLFVDHAVPHCRSNVVYKGALQGEEAHTVWIGDVLIRAEAEGTETYELNRNLVLTDGARADSVPNLEIETGEIVGAGHASATGRSTTRPCSTCSRAASRPTRRVAWWSVASSPT
jgi:Fe-S cluster assembly protein SufD